MLAAAAHDQMAGCRLGLSILFLGTLDFCRYLNCACVCACRPVTLTCHILGSIASLISPMFNGAASSVNSYTTSHTKLVHVPVSPAVYRIR
ncbi:hypothetical protein CC79DRAFT_1131742 [Sarocladium strictum]